MSKADQEAPITEPFGGRPSLHLGRIRQVRPRDLGYRFAAGAVTSIVAGCVTLAFGPRAGGILLAFPAILAASLTLIDEQENSAKAREDARGAVAGACALGLFAAVAALTLGRMSGALALLLAAVVWFCAALLIYFLAWFRRLR